MYGNVMNGDGDRRLKTLDKLMAFCRAIHWVYKAVDEYPPPQCEGNPMGLTCHACKSFKGHGICSHVLGVSHILQKFNVRYQLLTIGKASSKKNKGRGNTVAPLPALQRVPRREPDSSDEEEER